MKTKLNRQMKRILEIRNKIDATGKRNLSIQTAALTPVRVAFRRVRTELGGVNSIGDHRHPGRL